MGKLIDIIGKKIGRLTVVKRSYPNAKNKDLMYVCKCECGTEKIIRGKDLRRGATKSCGCLHNEALGNRQRIAIGLATMRAVIGSYKRKAKIRGLEWNLAETQFKEITQQNCHYCGAKPNNVGKHETKNGNYIYNGLDRINNNKGYMIDNIVPCCKHCNVAKNDMTLQEFKDWIGKVHNKILARGQYEKIQNRCNS